MYFWYICLFKDQYLKTSLFSMAFDPTALVLPWEFRRSQLRPNKYKLSFWYNLQVISMHTKVSDALF